jgi:hypothetical protein
MHVCLEFGIVATFDKLVFTLQEITATLLEFTFLRKYQCKISKGQTRVNRLSSLSHDVSSADLRYALLQ